MWPTQRRAMQAKNCAMPPACTASFLRRVASVGARQARAVAFIRPAAGACFASASFTAKGLAAAAPRTTWAPMRSMSTAAFGGEGGPPKQSDPAATLFVGNLPWSMDENGLREFFSGHSPATARVIFDRESGRSKGIAFVSFGSPEEANRASSELNGKVRAPPARRRSRAAGADLFRVAAQEVDGRPVRVELRLPPGEKAPYTERPKREFAPRAPFGDRGDRPPRPVRAVFRRPVFRRTAPTPPAPHLQRQENDDRKLYVGNLAWAVDQLDLEDIFKEFGPVESALARPHAFAATHVPAGPAALRHGGWEAT